MASSPRPGSLESTDATIRKRVCKACDRCRLKKSKCDGANPCTRCKQDNAICVFGDRKKHNDKAHPKGYVEMLERQQIQLVAGLQDMYRRLQKGERWPGAPLTEEANGHPLTHNILESLNVLHDPEDGNEVFEEDLGRMRRRLLDSGASYVGRSGSFSSDSEHDHEHHQLSPISGGTPRSGTSSSAPAHQPMFSHPFARPPMTPPTSQSPALGAQLLNTSFNNSPGPQVSSVQPAALHPSALQDTWGRSMINANRALEDHMNSMEFASFDPQFEFTSMNFEPTMTSSNSSTVGFGATGPLLMSDFESNPTDLEFSYAMSQREMLR